MESWFTVELESGGTAKDCGGQWLEYQAVQLAEDAASKTDKPIVVVEHTRKVVATYRRKVEISVVRKGAGDE